MNKKCLSAQGDRRDKTGKIVLVKRGYACNCLITPLSL